MDQEKKEIRWKLDTYFKLIGKIEDVWDDLRNEIETMEEIHKEKYGSWYENGKDYYDDNTD